MYKTIINKEELKYELINKFPKVKGLDKFNLLFLERLKKLNCMLFC